MKKKKLDTKLKLQKKVVSNLNNIKGGGFTSGCSDGCSPFASYWNCTEANCTADCDLEYPDE